MIPGATRLSPPGEAALVLRWALGHTMALLVPGTGGLCSPGLSLDPVLSDCT